MKKILTSIVAVSFLALGTASFAEEPKQTINKDYTRCIEKYNDLIPSEEPGKIDSKADYVSGEFLLGFDKDVTREEANKFIESYDINDEIELVEHNEIYTKVKVPKGKEVEYLCMFQSMKDDTIVKYAEPNHIQRIELFEE